METLPHEAQLALTSFLAALAIGGLLIFLAGRSLEKRHAAAGLATQSDAQ